MCYRIQQSENYIRKSACVDSAVISGGWSVLELISLGFGISMLLQIAGLLCMSHSQIQPFVEFGGFHFGMLLCVTVKIYLKV